MIAIGWAGSREAITPYQSDSNMAITMAEQKSCNKIIPIVAHNSNSKILDSPTVSYFHGVAFKQGGKSVILG